jgi:diadenosine tetraphosphate (Ap4A) HIT family hydrolase
VEERCPVCSETGNNERLVFRDSSAAVYHMGNVALPGYLVLAPIRHVTLWKDLEGPESASLERFRALAETFLLQKELIRKVYFLSFGELCPHIHIHCFPRTTSMAGEIPMTVGVDGPRVFDHYRTALKTDTSPPEVISMIETLRREFQDHLLTGKRTGR